MSDFTHTAFWKSAFEAEGHESEREWLKVAFLKFRERAAHLTGEIARDLPDYTVHDVTHLDALWEMAALIAGDDYPLTPVEVFVLGGAFLVHDAGMSLAAYPDGEAGLRKERLWADTVGLLIRRKYGRPPREAELLNPPEEIERDVKELCLRLLHAKRAAKLAIEVWRGAESGERYHLIEEPELRRIYGAIIGKIGASHWWDPKVLTSEFSAVIGAPTRCPGDWTVDPLKLACLLRVSDASHIDARRAPDALRTFRRPSSESGVHWSFQNYLQRPQVKDGRLIFTAATPFSVDDAEAWWLCRDTLLMIDRELDQVDSVLADAGRKRFRARGVAGIGNIQKLANLVPTEDWRPVDAQIKVGNVAKLVYRAEIGLSSKSFPENVELLGHERGEFVGVVAEVR